MDALLPDPPDSRSLTPDHCTLMLLAGDIGGTSTRLALFDIVADKLTVVALTKYHSRDHAGLEEIVRAFLTDRQVQLTAPIAHSAFGIAGPVREGKVHTSNLPWVVDAAELAANLKIADVHLLNDLEANAAGIAALAPADFVTLNAGQRDRHGNAAIISAGTGLGEAGIYFNGRQLYPFACEGGHSDFSPRDSLEAELLSYLREKFVQTSAEHVSWERVLSGPGLHNIYEFLRDTSAGKKRLNSRRRWLAAIHRSSFPKPASTARAKSVCRRSRCSYRSTALKPAIWLSNSWPRAACTSAGALRPRSFANCKSHDSWRLSSPKAA